MMVVGIVGDTLLVQNWWRKAPFVQMSIDYLDTHEGQLSALPIGYREHKMLISNLGRVMKAELNSSSSSSIYQIPNTEYMAYRL